MTATTINTERSATTAWNLDYIDSKGTTPVQNGDFLSLYTGRGVHVFLFDTGINVTTGSELSTHRLTIHPFGCLNLSDLVINHIKLVDDCDESDFTTHGTHVAAVIAGDTLGVARDVKLYITKITQDQSYTFLGRTTKERSIVLARKINAAIAYVNDPVNNIPANSAIFNFSAGFFPSELDGMDPSFEQSVISARNAGILMVIAAGNDAALSANNYSPGRLGVNNGIIDVAAVDINLHASKSDGSVVDMYAPGVNLSTGGASLPSGGGGTPCHAGAPPCNLGGTVSGFNFDGSSFSAPYVAGVAAQYIEYATANGLPHDPVTVEAALKANALAPASMHVQGNKAFANSRFLLLEAEPLTIKSQYCLGFNTAQWPAPKGVVGVANTVSQYTLTGAVSGGTPQIYSQGTQRFRLFQVFNTTFMSLKACKGNYCSTPIPGSRTARPGGNLCQ